jgi:hypothetical protein
MDAQEFITKAKEHIASVSSVAFVDMFVVWQSKILQNNKALISWRNDFSWHSDPDILQGVHVVDYVEVTYNGDKEEFYFDWYEKALNEAVKL